MKKDYLIGKKFGYLTVLESVGVTKAGHSLWKCQCDCGKIVERTGTSMKRCRYSSCGCWSRFGKDNPLWEGYGDISKTWFYNVIVRAASGRKSRRNIAIPIDIDIIYL